MKPIFSVIIPIYNVEQYIHKCLDSIINQTFQNIEIILIDDGSPDRCGKICDEYAEQDKRIKVIHKKNQGVGAARNDGIKNANGEWVVFMDPDDWCELSYFENMFLALDKKNVDIFMSGGYFEEYRDCQSVKRHLSRFEYTKQEQIETLMAEILDPKYCSVYRKEAVTTGFLWDKMYRRMFLENEQIFFATSFHPLEDLLFNLLAYDKSKKVVGCEVIGYHYRMVESSSTHKYNPVMPFMYYDFIEEIYTYINQRKENDLLKKAIYVRVIYAFITSCDSYYFHENNTMTYLECSKSINNWKNKKIYHEAIYCKSNDLLTRNQRIYRRILKSKHNLILYIILKIRKVIKRSIQNKICY